ncbi:unnamed protein product [Psylliodes chrysocephalus]|uniref:Uncharacterized protein n=1 Tax=Psylliodes chrysocephalus TaxID=3402493 RepID=A0A9P0GBV9_9CUCU|nr:unnamed protein product [Psylliodes chrysocephala]
MSESTPKIKFKTLPLPPNVIGRQMNFGGNNPNIETDQTIKIQTGNAGDVQTKGGPSSSKSVQTPAAPVLVNITPLTPIVPSKSTGTLRRVNSDPRIKIHVNKGDIPNGIEKNILEYNSSSVTSEEELNDAEARRIRFEKRFDNLPHSPNSFFEIRNAAERAKYMEEHKNDEQFDKNKEEPFIMPKKFSSNFHKLVREKSKQTITKTSNTFQALTDESESDSELDDEIGKIVKKRKKKGQNFRPFNVDEQNNKGKQNNDVTDITVNKNPKNVPKDTNPGNSNKNTNANSKQKTTMPPIVIDGKTSNHSGLIQDIKAMVRGEFSVKHTNYTTILFVDQKEDYDRVIESVKSEKIAFHTYTANSDKSHAFVLRGLAEGTKIQAIKDSLEEEHEIIAKENVL